MELGEEHSLRIVSEDGFAFTDFAIIEPFSVDVDMNVYRSVKESDQCYARNE